MEEVRTVIQKGGVIHAAQISERPAKDTPEPASVLTVALSTSGLGVALSAELSNATFA